MSFLGFDHGETIGMLRDTVSDFAAKEIAPRAADIDREEMRWSKLVATIGLKGE